MKNAGFAAAHHQSPHSPAHCAGATLRMAEVNLEGLIAEYLRVKGHEKAAESLGGGGSGGAAGPAAESELRSKVMQQLVGWAKEGGSSGGEARRQEADPEAREAQRVNKEPIKIGRPEVAEGCLLAKVGNMSCNGHPPC
eukprot:evm.model.scf_1162.3 EVM.evm.TU.scf_1162.3   scf_1162:20627-21664(-)